MVGWKPRRRIYPLNVGLRVACSQAAATTGSGINHYSLKVRDLKVELQDHFYLFPLNMAVHVTKDLVILQGHISSARDFNREYGSAY